MTAWEVAPLADLGDNLIRIAGEDVTYERARRVFFFVKLTRRSWCFKKGSWTPEGADWGFQDRHRYVHIHTKIELVSREKLVKALIDKLDRT